MSATQIAKRAAFAQSTSPSDTRFYGLPANLLRLVPCPKDDSISEIRGESNGLFHVLWTRPTQVDPRLLPISNRAAIWIAAAFEKLRLPFWVGKLVLVNSRKRNLLASRPSREASLRSAAGVRAP